MSHIQKQLNSFIQAHREREIHIVSKVFSVPSVDIVNAPNYELQNCLKDVDKLVSSMGAPEIYLDIENEYEVVEDYELSVVC